MSWYTLYKTIWWAYALFQLPLLKPNINDCNPFDLINKSKTIRNSIQSKKITNSYLIFIAKSICKKSLKQSTEKL